ncbi:MAG: DUF5996 family protein [Vicinamibacterales bacterium]
MQDHAWPELPYEAWKDTYATLHMWMQMAGKVAVALAPPINHAWSHAFQMTARGISTPLLPHDTRVFAIEFDFIDHQMIVRASDGAVKRMALAPRPVAGFFAAFTELLASVGLDAKVWPMPVEVPDPVRFDKDMAHHHYDPEWANRAWRVFVNAWRVLNETRAPFIGKASPTHFFWGSFDLAVARFSGRPAPPREGPPFMRDAYSHEVISHGFWPGNAMLPEPAFYAYAAPEPDGLKTAAVRPAAAYYHAGMGEFILPYEAVRTSADPEGDIRAFVESTYAAAADLGGWDRTALER